MSIFGSSDEQLQITLKAKDEASATLAKVNTSVSTLARGFALGTVAVGAFSAGYNVLSGFITSSLKEWSEQNAAIAQMQAVLTSTGYAAGVTSKELIDLSESLAKVTLYQDEVVLSAESMLLTFTNITKDIFPQTTKAVLDMSTALGQDLKSSAIQLGKALNNPIEGVAALQRVGVAFTNAQQEQIATMVKSGQTMEAQKFILAEINKEFGGSAESAYAAASSVEKLQKNFKNLEEDVGHGLTPALNNLFGAFQDVNSGMGSTVNVGKTVFVTLSKVEEVAVAAATGVHFLAAGLVDASSAVARFAANASGLSYLLKLFGINSNQFIDDFQQATEDGVQHTASLYDMLKSKNKAVLASWDETTASARVMGRVGPAAYEATAEEAKKAADAIKKAEKATADAKKTLDDYRKDLMGDTDNIADLFVQQEKTVHEASLKVQDARKKYDAEQEALSKKPRDQDQQDAVVAAKGDLDTALADLKKESDALNNAATIRQQLPEQVLNSERRSMETGFERDLEDAFKSINKKGADFAQQATYNITFGDAVIGDEGIKRVITQAIEAINRQAALSTSAGR